MSAVVKKRLSDSKKLERLFHVGPKGRVFLFEQYSRPNGRFCDTEGTLDPIKVRHVYMLAGMIPPKEDSEILEAISKDVSLLNAFLEHSGSRDTRKPEKKTKPLAMRSPRKVSRSPKRHNTHNSDGKKPL